MSETVLKAVGGKENITSVTHCATRLRIDARDTSIIDLQLAKSADQALGAVVSGGQLQVIIGPNVTEAYNDFLDFAGIPPQAQPKSGPVLINVTPELLKTMEPKNSSPKAAAGK